MNLSQIKTCQNCNQLRLLGEEVDANIYKRAKLMWDNKRFNTFLPWDRDVYKDLLRYKRIIEARIHNPSYPDACTTTQSILGRVEVLINK